MVLKNTILNKWDIILIVFILFFCLLGIFFPFTQNNKSKYAIVYYKNNEVLRINLNTKLQKYEIKGDNGMVMIEAGEGKIRVIEEKSKKHLCSKQGYIDKEYQSIICLPNRIVIELENQNYDTTI